MTIKKNGQDILLELEVICRCTYISVYIVDIYIVDIYIYIYIYIYTYIYISVYCT